MNCVAYWSACVAIGCSTVNQALTAAQDAPAFTEIGSPLRSPRRGARRTQKWNWNTRGEAKCDCVARTTNTPARMATPFSVILTETHFERSRPSDPFWLAYYWPCGQHGQPSPHQQPGDQKLEELWLWHEWRWPVEPSIRFRKQQLRWTLPRFQTPERCERWKMLLSIV
jgi:hypothetical protein